MLVLECAKGQIKGTWTASLEKPHLMAKGGRVKGHTTLPTYIRGRVIGILIVAAAASGCTTTHIYQADPENIMVRPRGNDPWTEWEDKTLTTFFWGAVRQDLPVVNCRRGDGTPTGIHEIRVKKNFFQGLVTFVTIGLVRPVTYGWRCQKPSQTGGRLRGSR